MVVRPNRVIIAAIECVSILEFSQLGRSCLASTVRKVVMTSPTLELKPIDDLLEQNFIIPSYQRGYRWTTTQVEDLLDDIWEFNTTHETAPKEVFYCLQPIVVGEIEDGWELVDGQQRLTTIYLILEYLKDVRKLLFPKKNFTLQYRTRPDSWTFLQNIDLDRSEENIDYHHICDAWKTIDKWFSNKKDEVKVHFLTTLIGSNTKGKNVKVIWYDISNEDAQDGHTIDVFTRINMGKIRLTNAELIKALFLGKIQVNESDQNRAYLKRLRIATEWDHIEYALQEDAFWYFIYEGKEKYDTRIEYIFDLMMKKPDDAEENYTFIKFNRMLNKESSSDPVETVWLRVKKYFQIFNEWYHDRTLFHLIGFLIATGSSIATIKAAAKDHTKTEFRMNLHGLIREQIGSDYEQLEYPSDKIKPLLLLHNIQTMLANQESKSRFPFHSYKHEHKWDIEHVRSVQSDKPTGTNRRKWLRMIVEYFTGETEQLEQFKEIDSLKDNERELIKDAISLIEEPTIRDDEFTRIYDGILKLFGEDKDPDNIDSIANLALLDSKTNRSYKNSPFPVKRQIIYDKDRTGSFIPICTRNVFLKSYSKKFDDVMFWKESDARDYLSAIKDSMAYFIDDQIKGVDDE